MLAFRVEGLRR